MNQNQMFSNLPKEEFIDHSIYDKAGDVSYGAGVLTIDLGKFGTYVINKQSPNKQIWLSSPTSGPKRYDYSMQKDCWIYKHDGNTLHQLLKTEFELILDKQIDISKCNHSNIFLI
ncbi:hypothetical protein GWI33_022321 [Rhynchophorus ferrugineus]|uniref:ferroxidase n=1 Tax=Rhynchophorus ferrugineus TaxID=354439 RepID=A0A834MHY8_RHYFE|nr:hypothetical protein GWI33_022321 [Rhynchophorus ferrugineus]